MNWLQQACNWISKQEDRLTTDNIDCPNTKCVFVRFIEVQLSVVQTREALLGTRCLLEWLGQKKGLIALDMCNDNLCLFRCLALHQGVQADRSTAKAKELTTSFYNEQNLVYPDQSRQSEKHFKLGIRVYQLIEQAWQLTRQPHDYPNTMTIGMFEQHAFYIKDIKRWLLDPKRHEDHQLR